MSEENKVDWQKQAERYKAEVVATATQRDQLAAALKERDVKVGELEVQLATALRTVDEKHQALLVLQNQLEQSQQATEQSRANIVILNEQARKTASETAAQAATMRADLDGQIGDLKAALEEMTQQKLKAQDLASQRRKALGLVVKSVGQVLEVTTPLLDE